MVFSSPIFLFGFLPIILLLYFVSPRRLKNFILLLGSLFFYAWGEVFYLLIMLVSIGSNYLFGRLIGGSEGIPRKERLYLSIGIAVNVSLLVSYKYANFIADNVNILLWRLKLPVVDLDPVHLPLGISFFTFQAISYIVDVYRNEVPVQKNPLNLALYISLFPQLIAGPIVRYHDVSSQITARTHSLALFSSGVQRFIFGLAKKMLIANPLGEVADTIFNMSTQDLATPLAWIGVLSYTLQIYFDFSGYSDMAIGLGRMFGFRFLENFNYPYISTSLREFWRRWHISLSTWFRDYVYIALGGSRVSTRRVYLNLLLVFILTGFWHGASWNFLIWGLFHGVFLASEHAGLSKVLGRLWRPIQHLYVLGVAIIGWVFFRAENLDYAVGYLKSMAGFTEQKITQLQYAQVLSREAIIVFVIGVILSVPIYPTLRAILKRISGNSTLKRAFFVDLPRLPVLVSLLFLCLLKVASSTYNPFIYFRF